MDREDQGVRESGRSHPGGRMVTGRRDGWGWGWMWMSVSVFVWMGNWDGKERHSVSQDSEGRHGHGQVRSEGNRREVRYALRADLDRSYLTLGTNSLWEGRHDGCNNSQ